MTLAMVADTLGLIAFAPLGNKLFILLYPDSKNLFFNWNKEYCQSLSASQKKTLYKSLTSFSARRSLFYYPMNFLKITPATLIIIFYWHHDCSNLMQLGKFLIIEIPIQIFIAGTTLIEAHTFISKKIKELHEWVDLTDIFKTTNTLKAAKFFSNFEAVSFISLTISLFGTIFLVSIQTKDLEYSSFFFFATIFFGHLLIIRLYFLNRIFINEGLNEILLNFSTFKLDSKDSTIALSSSGFLARFGQVYNELTLKLQINEREMAQWVVREVEESRFKTVGEIAGMVAHDLRSPLNTINYCIETLKENHEKIHDERFMNQLSLNSDRSIELIKSLMAYLKNHSDDEQESIYESLSYVKNILSTQYPKDRFNMIHFNIDPKLKDVKLTVSRINLIHILNNLIQNSLNNLIKNNVPFPTISIKFEGYCEEKISISYQDNGTGLKRNDFETLTAFGHSISNNEARNRGLGLRLTKRLIERNNGNLDYIDASQGTHFRLSFSESATDKNLSQINLQ